MTRERSSLPWRFGTFDDIVLKRREEVAPGDVVIPADYALLLLKGEKKRDFWAVALDFDLPSDKARQWVLRGLEDGSFVAIREPPTGGGGGSRATETSAGAGSPVVLGPSSEAARQTWFSLKVLDDVGAPLDGIDVAYMVGGARRVVQTNGAGVARLDPVDAGSFASASPASLTALRDKLKPRWKQPRDPKIPTGDDVVVKEIEDAVDSIGLQAETATTLVVLPYFNCNEIPGAHFAFGRSFPLSVALEPLAAIAQALSDDDGRKAMIFGHTDLSGPEALNKALSERRAKALYALLTQDADAWEALYSGTADGPDWKEKWDLEEIKHMLNTLGVTDDAGSTLEETRVADASATQAIRRFQAGNYPEKPAEQAALPQSDTLDAAGRKELFLAYAKRISRKPVDKGRLSSIGGSPYMGCGEYNPLSLSVKDDESRRAVIFVYDPAAEPQSLPCALGNTGPCKSNCGPLATAPDPDGKPPYRCKIYQAVASKCPCQGGADVNHDLVVRIPLPLDVVNGFEHVLILESDDGTISRTQTLKSDARALDADESEIFFPNLPHAHQYRLRAEGVPDPYEVFPFTPFEDLSDLSDIAPAPADQSAPTPDLLLNPTGGDPPPSSPASAPASAPPSGAST